MCGENAERERPLRVEVIGTVGNCPWLRVSDRDTGVELLEVKSVEFLPMFVRVTQFVLDTDGRNVFLGPDTLAETVLETSDVQFVFSH